MLILKAESYKEQSRRGLRRCNDTKNCRGTNNYSILCRNNCHNSTRHRAEEFVTPSWRITCMCVVSCGWDISYTLGFQVGIREAYEESCSYCGSL